MRVPRAMQSLQNHHWWWRGMRFLYSSALQREFPDISKRLKIIDVGCGYGANVSTLERFGDVVGIDVSLDVLRSIPTRPSLGLVQARADALPFRADAFDVIALLAVIEHVADHEGVLSESHRMARPGALQLMLTSAFMILWSDHDVANRHHRRYRRRELNALQRKTHWHIVYTSYINMLIFPAVAAIRFLQRHAEPSDTARYDMGPSFGPLNHLLEAILKIEAALVTRLKIRLPFGVNLFSVARRAPDDYENIS